MRTFIVIWVGQLVSLLGSGMTRFALTIWAWELTGQATALALVGLFAFAPGVLISPLAGALVDRWDRKRAMMVSDVAAGLSSVAILLLLLVNQLELWHLLAAGFFASTFEAFQFPAYSSAITMMVSKDQYTRANSMLGVAQSISQIAAPALAAILLVIIGISGILVIDIVSFIFAVGVLFFVHIPNPPVSLAGEKAKSSLWQESLFGFRYIYRRSSLLGLQLMFFFINLTMTMGIILLPAMILARTGNDEVLLGTVQSALGAGGLVGSIALMVWGGPRRRVHGVLMGMVLASFGQITIGIGNSLPTWALGAFSIFFFIPIVDGSNQAIWQAKVPPDIQGRVFAVRRLIAQITAPVAMLIAGPLADFIFEPAMLKGGMLVETFGELVGTGPGAGMGLLFVISGFLGIMAALSGYVFPAIRNAEDILPDHELITANEVAGSTILAEAPA